VPKPPLPDHIVEVLTRPNPAVIGVVRGDGAPVTVPTWYVYEDGRILVNMDAERRRLDHLRSDPRVSLTVLDGDDWYNHVSFLGRITLQDDPGLADIDRIARHYTGEQYGYANRERPRVSGWIDIESWHAWGALRR
jgi:PPOX class probable F420-dependent enzyme